MQYMLDTDIVSYVIRSRSPGLLATMQEKTHVAALSISVVTYAELRLGAERSRSARRLHEAPEGSTKRLTRSVTDSMRSFPGTRLPPTNSPSSSPVCWTPARR